MKRLLLYLIITIFSIGGGVARSFKYVYNNITFKCSEEKGGITITSFDDNANFVVIPGSIEGVPVRKVNCFINGHNYMAKEVVIEEGVEEIAKFCFNEFRQLRKVTVPLSLTKVNSNAFRKNNNITFFGPDNFNFALLQDYTSRPFNVKTYPDHKEVLAMQSTDSDKESHNMKLEDEIVQKAKKGNNIKKQKGELIAQTTKIVEQDYSLDVKEQRLSDVDVNIPQAKKVNASTYCFIIANEKYDDLPIVNYAENDGTIFRDYCIKTLGVPEEQVFLYVNASFISMTRALKKMENLAAATDGKSKFIFYYAGHGTPSEEDQKPLLVPSDGLVTVPSTCFSLGELYERFGKMEAESVVMLLDACFSGLNRDNSSLIAARGVALKPKKEKVSGNVIVLSATSESETAMGYDEKGHGMFTYHVLKKIQQSKGNVKFAELYRAVSDGVRRDAIIKNDKNQTPSLTVSPNLKTSWENMGF